MLTDKDRAVLERIGDRIRELRGDRSLGWLGREVGTHATGIRRIEKGEHEPGILMIAQIAEALGVTVDKLLDRPAKHGRRSA